MSEATLPEFESLEGMPPAAAQGLHDLLWALADTKLLLGYHYGEWTFGTPELEAAVANCSLSQSELGHVRLLHAILKKHWDDDPDTLVAERPAAAFANVGYLDRAVEGWPGLVAMNAVVDLATTRVLAALRGSAFKPLRMSVDKMLDEERHHAHHGRGWFRTLGRRPGEDAEQLATATAEALGAVTEWLGPPDHAADRALASTGIQTQPVSDVLAGITADVAALASEAGVAMSRPGAAAPNDWNPHTRRRAGSAGPADDILFHLRGDANAIFRLGE
jgi:phenylacetate-CoA oxygenase PaaI subunit